MRVRTLRRLLLMVGSCLAVACILKTRPLAQGHAAGTTYARLQSLDPSAVVFAYGRISPDGRRLAYSLQPMNQSGLKTRTLKVIDVSTHKLLFTDQGIDGYWSPDGHKLIYKHEGTPDTVRIWDRMTGVLQKDIAPSSLGDYFSWAKLKGRDLIETIQGNTYYLDSHDRAEEVAKPVNCTAGTPDRPLISKDGTMISGFVNGAVAARSVFDCSYFVTTHINGGKADFSWDDRYLTFHVYDPFKNQYYIAVADLQQKVFYRVTKLQGSSYYPSWTRDGRIVFRYDGPEYRGFMMASNVLSNPTNPLPEVHANLRDDLQLSEIVPRETDLAGETLIQIWAPWNAHAPHDLDELRQFSMGLAARFNLRILTIADPTSVGLEVGEIFGGNSLERVSIDPKSLVLTGAENQVPVTLLFRGERLSYRHLGSLSAQELTKVVTSVK